MYSIDSCVLIDLNKRMPRDVWPSIWDSIESLIAEPRAFTCREVKTEIDQIDDSLKTWLKGTPPTFVEAPTPAEIAMVAEISTRHPGWVELRQNAADPWLIANAAVRSRALVTSERMRGRVVMDHKLKIPQVAGDFGVECIDLNDLARREGWRY